MSDTEARNEPQRTRIVKLLPEIDRKLAKYAKVRHTTPELIAAAAIEHHLKEHADHALRLADARATFEKERRRG